MKRGLAAAVLGLALGLGVAGVARAAIDTYQPIRNKDPEHFKSVVTGVIALDKDDEGFSSIHLNVKMDEIYKYFKKLINDYEIRVVRQLRP